MEGLMAIFFMGMILSFAFACCCCVCCSSCILGALYKFHFTAKELDIIQSLPNVSQVAMQQFPGQQHQVQPQAYAGENIVRGQVVSINDPNAQQP